MEEETSGGPLRGRDRRCCCSCGWLVRSTVVTTIWRSRIPAAPSRFSRAVADRAQGPPFPPNRLPFRDLSLQPRSRSNASRSPTIDPSFDKRVHTNERIFLEFTLTLDNISMRWLRTKVERLERIDLKLPRRGNQELVESTIRGKRDGELLK